MKLSLAAANILMKVDTKDYLGFALNNAINKIITDKINKGK